jgi:hypothetical protein
LRESKGKPGEASPGRPAAIRREAIRILCAFALYLVLHLVGVQAVLHDAYKDLVLRTGTLALPCVQHFPALSTLENLDIRNLDFVVTLLICLFVVSIRIPLPSRIVRFGACLAIVFASNVAAVLLQSQILATEQLQSSAGLMLYLPWEFHVLDGLKYLLYDFGMEASTFVLLLLTVTWNSPEIAPVAFLPGTGVAPRNRSRASGGRGRTAAIAFGGAALSLVAILAWGRIRESNPLHCRTHARLGDLFLQGGGTAKAEAQYRAAIAGGVTEGAAWLHLAELLRQRGATLEADRILRQGAGIVTDADDRRRLQEALSAGAATR